MPLKIIRKVKKDMPLCTKYGYVTTSKLTKKYIKRLEKLLEQER